MILLYKNNVHTLALPLYIFMWESIRPRASVEEDNLYTYIISVTKKKKTQGTSSSSKVEVFYYLYRRDRGGLSRSNAPVRSLSAPPRAFLTKCTAELLSMFTNRFVACHQLYITVSSCFIDVTGKSVRSHMVF